MSKAKSVFACQTCGHHTTKWLGRCPECGGWNTFAEELQASPRPARQQGIASTQLPLPLTEIARSGEERLLTGIGELDRVLGGGLVRGSLVLIGGDPGIGKSTLLLQATAGLSSTQYSMFLGRNRRVSCVCVVTAWESTVNTSIFSLKRLWS
jgi:DNA repair protein RadA/Sms